MNIFTMIIIIKTKKRKSYHYYISTLVITDLHADMYMLLSGSRVIIPALEGIQQQRT